MKGLFYIETDLDELGEFAGPLLVAEVEAYLAKHAAFLAFLEGGSHANRKTDHP